MCSKNDDAKAREPFQAHGDMVLAETDISCFIANWDEQGRQPARCSRSGSTSAWTRSSFLDDSPFERNLVRELAPEVCVPELPEDPAEFVPYLESLNLFEATQFSEEDRQPRRLLPRERAARRGEQAQFTDVGEYLASLEMEAEFERFDDHHLPRIAQLVQRTNQFNLTTIRHSAAELKDVRRRPGLLPVLRDARATASATTA